MASTHRDEISRLELLHAAHPDGLVFPHLADAYRRAGRYAQAESLLRTGLRRHDEYSSAHVVLGRLRLDQGRHAEARHAFERVLQLDPQNQVAREYLGRLAMEQGQTEEALRHSRELLRLKPGPELEQRVRELERRLAEERTARAPTRSAGPGGPPTEPVAEPPARHARAAPSGNGQRATGTVGAGLQLPEPGEVVTETMAELYSRQGLHTRAAAVYRQLLRGSPGDTRLSAKLAAEEAREAAAEPPRAPRRTSPPFGPTIGSTLTALLSWQPRSPEPEPEPGRDAPVPPPVPAARPAEPGGALTATRRSPTDPRRAPTATRRTPTPAPRVESDPKGPEVEAADSRSRSLIALTDMLVGLLEYRDPFFRGSSSLTRLLASSVAQELSLTPTQQVDLSLAAVLRDLGRLALGGRLVTPTGARTPEIRRKIERHVDLALHLMEGIDVPDPVRLAVRHHHERWDGAGYPDRLSGEDIPLLARVLAVVDSFAAMVSPRPYRLPRKLPEAARELQEAAGRQYDPDVVAALLRVLARRDQPNLGFVQRHHVLLVNPDQPGAVVTAAKLCSAGYLAEVAADPESARERLRRVPVAGLVVSAEAGAEEMAALIRDLRVDPTFATLPIVVVDAVDVALRVRLLESGADVCFPPGISYAELRGTLNALFRRNIRAERKEGGAGSPWLALQGDIRDFPLTWLLQVMKYDSRTAAIGIRTAEADGAIYLQKGDAVHARIRDGEKGEPALRKMMGWKAGRFTVQPDARPRERTIDTSIMHLLLTQAVDEDHAAAGIFGAVSEG